MRKLVTLIAFSALPLALAACGPKADNAATNATTEVVPASESTVDANAMDAGGEPKLTDGGSENVTESNSSTTIDVPSSGGVNPK